MRISSSAIKTSAFLLIAIVVFTGCIKDDFIDDKVDPIIRINNPLDTIALNTSYTFEAEYLNNVGEVESATILWTSSDTSIISISQEGLAQAKQLGTATLTVSLATNTSISASNEVTVGDTTVMGVTERTASLITTSSYDLSGDAILRDEGNGTLTLELAANYNADTGLPGLYIYLSNNPNSTSGAHEISAVQVFNGAHSYTITGVGINDYQYVLYFCKPFNARVGHGLLN